MSIDPIWEQKYEAGHAQNYPWDSVVSFVFRHAARMGKRSNVRILEVGCGTGSNLWFAAREGFVVTGIDGSESAIQAAQTRFMQEGLQGDFRVANFDQLPFESASFDMVIDRGALTCASRSALAGAIDEVARVAKPEAYFLFTPFADSHSSLVSGQRLQDGTIVNISRGTLVNVGQISFVSRRELDELLPASKWKLQSVVRKEHIDMLGTEANIHAEWQVVAQRVPETDSHA